MSTLDCCSSLMMREEASAIRFSTVTVHVAIALPASVACNDSRTGIYAGNESLLVYCSHIFVTAGPFKTFISGIFWFECVRQLLCFSSHELQCFGEEVDFRDVDHRAPIF